MIGSGECGELGDNELILFAILLMLNILCDVIYDVKDKHVYVIRIEQ